MENDIIIREAGHNQNQTLKFKFTNVIYIILIYILYLYLFIFLIYGVMNDIRFGAWFDCNTSF